jgi:Putative restriction endonuclease
VYTVEEGTEKEDLGQTLQEVNQPPTEWEVYQNILRVPYYVLFDRYGDRLQAFALRGAQYQEVDLETGQLWLPELKLGLGLWQGSFQDIERLWLRWYDSAGQWLPTSLESAEQLRERADQERLRAEQERQRAEQGRERADREQQRADRLAERLRQLGIEE